MVSRQITIEDWDGDGGIRIPDEVLQEMGVDVGDSLYLIEEFVGTTRALLLSKTPRIPDRIDELIEHWDREQSDKQGKRIDSDE
ncbi:AbrB/MazE/SpoVT family DNA-binding domain-containing protein [Pseudomonas rustica]|jgi:antitoxin component of MazEF toxin-antitoxin module|uniref:AbrB/MazE/SpoVT family DNA-binding domain-containing protein n=1 Tax=Pseudomonas rustica TaxID=2827099 RepID=A0ABS5N1G2_9PSED|nr:AbrB/MazE/SpoVT family DNA-binding domain-containing protein [Pseudomonas rustica]MBS4080413.1 AbrB/MazE/SpoVT family DNA-binding domain-containing protein [Pseudomonas rustica]